MFIDLLKTRRSIRKFQDRPVENEKVDVLVEAVLRSPSSRSINLCLIRSRFFDD
ncbi:MAG: nitroreductase family protein [Desulfobacteraceae bacterium]|nr:nitroreductase family protein [Desulfobacteraceae bacterium]